MVTRSVHVLGIFLRPDHTCTMGDHFLSVYSLHPLFCEAILDENPN